MSRAWAKGSDTRWRRFRATIMTRDRALCRIGAMGCTRLATQVDHIVPLARGGAKYDASNCRAACASCNRTRRRPAGGGLADPPPVRRSSWPSS